MPIESGRTSILYVCSTSLHKSLLLNQLIFQGLYIIHLVRVVFSGMQCLELPSRLTSLASSLKIFFMIFEAFLPVLPFLAEDSCSYTMAQLAAIPGTSHEELFQNNSTCGHPYRVTTLLHKRMKRAHADVPELAFSELAPMKIMTLQLALRYSC